MSSKLSASPEHPPKQRLNDAVTDRPMPSSSAWRVMSVVYGLAMLFLGFTVALSKVSAFSIGDIVRDAVDVLGGHPIVGMQSYIGVLIWAATASICLFCYGLLRSMRQSVAASFFLAFGLVTLWLALDDLFLIHEYIAYGVLDVGETRIYAVYGAVVVGCFARFRRYIVRSQALPVLVAAIIFFGLSIAVDVVLHDIQDLWRVFLEEGLKLFGIVSWSGYFIVNGFRAIAKTAMPVTDSAQVAPSK